MLVNFCDKSLRTYVTCSTVSTEGYDVINLVNNSESGFLAYSCIRPPVNIDFNFICNVKLSHVLIWPQIGAQKSTGFKLSVKSAESNDQPLTEISTGFLQKHESGIFFFRRDLKHDLELIEKPLNFTERYIKSLNVANYASTLRLSIVKTDNSVPGLGKIEIWGFVSPKCAKDVVMNVMSLWINRFNDINSPSVINDETSTNDVVQKNDKQKLCEIKTDDDDALQIPEDFLDPITLEIMTQPIILPSGKIIDQKTLEKHGQNETIWGRSVTDPFTGIPFNEKRKPIAAFPLKERIDKFLLDNSNKEEVKKLPRVLGSSSSSSVIQSKNIKVIGCASNSNNNLLKRPSTTTTKQDNCNNFVVKKPFHGHNLPIMTLNRNHKINSTLNACNSRLTKEEIKKRNNAIDDKLNSQIQVTQSMLKCDCCSSNIFYKLPCDHVICRKALLLLEKKLCTICKYEFETSDPQRIHS